MAHNYYLLNGKSGEASTLNLLVDGKLKKDFKDISMLDLETTKIKNSDKFEYLSEYNKKEDLSGLFFEASFPHTSGTVKTYAPIFGYNNNSSKYYIDRLQSFAEQRKYKVLKDKNIALDQTKELEDYARCLLYNCYVNCYSRVTSYDCLVGNVIKEIFRDRYYSQRTESFDNFLSSRMLKIKKVLSSYTQLRYLTLEYVNYLEQRKTISRDLLIKLANWENKGMVPTSSFYIGEDQEYEQLTFDGFSKTLKNK